MGYSSQNMTFSHIFQQKVYPASLSRWQATSHTRQDTFGHKTKPPQAYYLSSDENQSQLFSEQNAFSKSFIMLWCVISKVIGVIETLF